jgi:glutamine amidotransferase
MQRIIVIDYGMGNLFSVAKKLTQIGASVVVSSSINDVETADKIILPGVGHFGKAMKNLNDLNLVDALNQKVLFEKTPVLGICLGMQLMCKSSEEGNCDGLNWVDAEVKRFQVNDSLRYKVPHTGWNQIQIEKESPVMQDLKSEDELYFVHSYHVTCNNTSDILNSTLFEQRFTSAFQKENIIGVQYHPEKSYDVGKQLIQNFINL